MSSVPSRKRQKLESGPTGESLGPSSERQESEKDSDWVLENRAEARENIDFFREKLVVFIPALSPKDFLDTERLIEKELSLVHCICYVTAKFLPGGENTQKKLHHKVSTITILDRFTVGDRDEEMSRMKALVILCCYAVVSSPNLPVRSNEISFWSLKSFIQLYAKQISLYKSIHELRAEITSNRETPIYETDAYQRYALWLQIFLLSHYSSITSGTPPDVMIDSTIRAVSWVMQEIGMHPQLRLLAEVELCLVWEKASSRKPELREWWCIHPDDISDTDDENLTEYALREAETEIESWRSKWQGYMHSPGVDGSILDYHSRTVRFYFSSYAVRRLRKSSQGLSDLQRDQVQRCVTNANHVLEWLLTRSPIQKERIRYVSESSCTMISFCCFFIIASCQTFTSSLQGIDETLGNVIDTAALLMNLSPKEHNAHRQGMVVLQRAEKLRAALERSASQETGVAGSGVPRVAGPDHPHLPTPGPSEEGFHADWTELGMGQDEPFSVDGFWDFSMFLPNAW
ncbi:hypothetical protein DL98DRAFT_191516 [Cadophora sp. DSE1049]|nr:hypothetical protein DL98DRAFT_191516 [Cadophora sp. DSE1049]